MSAVLQLRPAAAFDGHWRAVDADVQARMRDRSWCADPRCPGWDALALVEVDHWRPDATVGRGPLIVDVELADDTVRLFAGLFDLGFPIEAIALVDDYEASDEASMQANNTSAFNFRVIAGTDTLSQHAYGRAIDINPRWNPMVNARGFVPAEAVAWLDRGLIRPGMIVRPGPVVDLFDELGWEWGGDWTHVRDYHHVVKSR